MSWSLIRQGSNYVWRCTFYTDLRSLEINNLAEWGQPFNPYQQKFNHDFDSKHVNFSRVIVEMPQTEVMIKGYGRSVQPTDFAVVKNFLSGQMKIGDGTYRFQSLVNAGLASAKDRYMKANLYGRGDSGEIDSAEAAYIHGSVGFALMSGTSFVVLGKQRTVNAEIGALDDNWDFESGNLIASALNPLVDALIGPSNYNLQKPIKIVFFGAGVIRSASSIVK
jgi:hypothetical protein